MVGERALCGRCFQRIYRSRKSNESKIVDAEKCWICGGLSFEIEKFVDLTEEKIKEYEFDTFSIGSKIDEEIMERDDIIRKFARSPSSNIKTWLNREIGKVLEIRIGKKFVFSGYDINIIIDTRFDHVKLNMVPIYLYGRYVKLKRGIPQTKWPCRLCGGIGCRKCNYTGKQYPESIEEIIAKIPLEEFGGEDESFHGCGREDIDARMLGSGRPFVLEIKNPKRRNLDLKKVEEKINAYGRGKVIVKDLRYSNKEEVVRIKNEDYAKVYHAKIVCQKKIEEKKLKNASSFLEGKIIKQQTPLRVSHRRADKIREKKIYECKLIWVKDKEALIKIKAESGTYIKELVSGDEGRTTPSLSEIMGLRCEVKELDVIKVEGD